MYPVEWMQTIIWSLIISNCMTEFESSALVINRFGQITKKLLSSQTLSIATSVLFGCTTNTKSICSVFQFLVLAVWCEIGNSYFIHRLVLHWSSLPAYLMHYVHSKSFFTAKLVVSNQSLVLPIVVIIILSRFSLWIRTYVMNSLTLFWIPV